MAANQNIHDSLLRHVALVQHYVNGQSKNIIDAVSATDKELSAILYTSLESLQTKKLLSSARKNILDSTLADISKLRGSAFDEALLKYTIELETYIEYESLSIQDIFEQHNPIVIPYTTTTTAALTSALLERSSFSGLSLEEYFSKLKQGDIDRIISKVRLGMAQGLTTTAIIKSITGRNSASAVSATKRGVRTMVRTTINGIGNIAREEWYDANSDIIDTIEYVAVLDGRTTPICASLDGNKYNINEGPMPPMHLNCRSVRVPYISGMENIGNRPYVRDTRTAKKRRKDFRKDAKTRVGADEWKKLSRKERDALIRTEKQVWEKEAIGTVESTTTFKNWFDTQPSSFQQQYLGTTRFNMYKEGTPFDEFVGENGRLATLESLKENKFL